MITGLQSMGVNETTIATEALSHAVGAGARGVLVGAGTGIVVVGGGRGRAFAARSVGVGIGRHVCG